MPCLTPGLLFLIRVAPTLILPCCLYVASTRAKVYSPALAQVSNSVFALVSALVLPFIFFARVRYFQLRDRSRANALGARLIATPRGWPGNVGATLKFIRKMKYGYIGEKMKELLDANGNVFNPRPFFDNLIMTTEPHHIKTILATEFNNYVKGDVFQFACRSVLGHGVFNADGDMWKFHRSMTRPFLSRDRISDFELFDRHANEIIGLMKNRFSEGYAIDFQDAIARFTLDSATEFLFGSSVHSVETGLPYPHNAADHLKSKFAQNSIQGKPNADTFATAFLQSQVEVSDRLRAGWLWPLLELFEEKTDKHMREVNAFVEPIVKEAIKKNKHQSAGEKTEKNDSEESDQPETLLDHLVKFSSDEKLLKDETINILVAGRDTTAATLTFLFFFLATHPHVASRLRAEIMEHVGPTRMPLYEDIKHIKYLRAVINETLRLYPAVPGDQRESVNEAILAPSTPGERPYYVPPKTPIVYSVFLMHRRTDLWGPDAEEFDPDRFLDERLKKYLLPNNFIFLPFNAGPRICLGQQFAYNEMSFIIIRMLQQFSSVTLDRASHPPDKLPPPEWAQDPGRKGKDGLRVLGHLTIYIEGGLWLKFHEAKEDVPV